MQLIKKCQSLLISTKLFLLISFALYFFRAYSQQPSFFKIGENELKGIQVYDVIQDKQFNYWFATDNGLYFFNGIKFQQIECNEAESSSYFYFVINPQGTIYCKNLNNQIFQLKNGKCSLFHTLSKSEGNSDLSLAITDDGNLMLASKVIKILSPSGQTIQKLSIKKHYLGAPFTRNDGKLMLHLNASDSVLCYSKGDFSYQTLRTPQGTSLSILNFYQHDQHVVALDLASKNAFLLEHNNLIPYSLKQNKQINKTESIRLYPNSKGLWIAGTLPGISLESTDNKYRNTLYSDYFISDVYEDQEGNILLSTFDEGILVISDMNILDVINDFEDDPIMSIHSDEHRGLFLGSSQGKIIHYVNKKFRELNASGTRPVNVIGSHPLSDWLILDNGQIRALHKENGKSINLYVASLKAVAYRNKNDFFIGTNKGVVEIRNEHDSFHVHNITTIKERVYFMQFDTLNQLLYVSTTTGLCSYQNGLSKKLIFQHKPVYATGMCLKEDTLYVSTKTNSILLFTKGKFIKKLEYYYKNSLLSFKKIIVRKHHLIAETSNGFFQINLLTNTLYPLHTYYGLKTNRIIDFSFYDDDLWVSHTGGVQRIDMNYRNSMKNKLYVRIEQILINNREKNQSELTQLSADQNKIQFNFTSSTLRNRETIQYYYRLMGSDTVWEAVDFGQNQLLFNSLAPGKYSFQLKAENQGDYSNVIDVKFRILKPYYSQWWFITLISIAFLGITYFIYRWQLNRQREKLQRINELNSSKLTAIKSQMNPHFIFNSLNSIQDLILKGDVEHSYSYISTFSNMVRATLSNSEKEFIAIEQEIQLLELYLSLEKLRFKNDFEYERIYDKNMDILIPPMLIQPFIENALVHGLLHKKGTKKISIRFQLNEVFECIVEDNGIGRKAAHAIQSRQQRHESFSSKAIKKRFEILSHVYNGIFGFEYEDLETDGQNAGTRVTLKMPFIEKF